MATAISSRTMLPGKALAIVCAAEFFAPLFLGTAVANIVGKGILDINRLGIETYKVSMIMIFSALIGSILWNLFTWRIGLPSSSSHALIGALVGSGIMMFGFDMVNWGNFFWKVIAMLLITPIIGFFVGFILIKLIKMAVDRCSCTINSFFKTVQILGMVFLASSHGTNDAQKSMGVIALIMLVADTNGKFAVPKWAMVASALAISTGLSLGGWTIVKTVGTKIFKVKPIHSFNSQLSAALVIMTAGLFGGPVSTSQIVSSSIMGTGAGERMNGVNWGMVKEIMVSWAVTIPSAAVLSAAICGILKLVA